ncbi:MAG: preprotein translocase subunit YajC [Spirochaetales bacterium]|nr:preprotein translocase subunit YajC [Spirochaetales bacterium]
MNQMLFMLAQGAEAGAPAGQNPIFMIGFMAIFIIFFYFVVIRPQKKQQKEMQKMLDALKKGDKIVTIGGIIGKVAAVKDDVVVIRVNDSNTEITFRKDAVSKVVNQTADKKSEKKDAKDSNEETAQIENQSEQSDDNDTKVTEN